MRLRFFLWAAADFGVRRSKIEISLCRSGYIVVLRDDSGRRFRGPLDLPGNRKPPGYDTESDRAPKDALSLRSPHRARRRAVVRLEVQLQCDLHETRVGHFLGSSKIGAVRGVAIDAIEMGVIGDVENVPAEFKSFRFANRNFLLHREVGVVESWSTADRAFRRPEAPEQRWLVAVEYCSG